MIRQKPPIIEFISIDKKITNGMMRSLLCYYIGRAQPNPTSILKLLFFLMAVNCTCTSKIPNQKYGSFLKYPNKELMFKRNSVTLKKTSSVLRRITASIKNKVGRLVIM